MALESICMLIGEPYTDWKSIRQIIMKENFIPTIANFSTEDITDESRNKMKRDYMSHKEYNFDTVNHASKACGPLVKWAIAQVRDERGMFYSLFLILCTKFSDIYTCSYVVLKV